MSNKTDELAWHGSKLCMQMFVNNSYKKEKLDSLIGIGEIKWYSPLMTEKFKEYTLMNFFNLHSEFNTSKLNKELYKIRAQWDAIGVAPDGTLIIVEAKAHTDEMEENEESIISRKQSQDFSTIQRLISNTMGDNPIWVETYYQLANRYVYLENLNKAGIKTKLVYIYFVNDVLYEPTTKEEWDSYLDNLNLSHPSPKHLEENTIHIFYDMWKR